MKKNSRYPSPPSPPDLSRHYSCHTSGGHLFSDVENANPIDAKNREPSGRGAASVGRVAVEQGVFCYLPELGHGSKRDGATFGSCRIRGGQAKERGREVDFVGQSHGRVEQVPASAGAKKKEILRLVCLYCFYRALRVKFSWWGELETCCPTLLARARGRKAILRPVPRILLVTCSMSTGLMNTSCPFLPSYPKEHAGERFKAGT